MASSSSTIDNCENDVFLSFRSDVRNYFANHLYDSLCRANIQVYNDLMLERMQDTREVKYRAIERAKISVVVFSSNYASSTWCLDELVKIFECKESKGQIVFPIFYQVSPSYVRKLKGTYGEAFAIHEAQLKRENIFGQETSEELKVQRWKSALFEASNLAGLHIEDTCDEAETIRSITQVVLKRLYYEPTRKSKGKELISIPLVGESAAVNLVKTWKCLMDNNISRVGIHGMGGVGKTITATHIYNRAIRNTSPFQHVYWVTVSKDSSIYRLQSDIAKEIDLDLTREEDELKRAAKLWGALTNKGRFVLILDDMWVPYELEDVGIPISADGGKILLTTRIRRVCMRMQCEEIVVVETLPEREAMDLFLKESRLEIDDNPELRNFTESIVKECDGLPLAIVAIARSTRQFTEKYEWRNILQELRKPYDRQNYDMEEKVFKLLKISYDHLHSDRSRQCLHYFALYPKDCYMDRDDLIEYCIAGGVIDELDSRQEEFDMGNAIIHELIDVSLLEHNSGCVKMRDVVRNMVLTIMRGKLFVKAGLQLQEFPKFTDWSTNLEGISIMANHSLKGCYFNSAPSCYKLRILLLQNNEKLSELPSCFFVHMQNLTILDMSGLWSLKLLPDSISQLEALRMLNLDACYSLEYVPSLIALKDLRFLKLGRTNLQKLPKGMEKLVNLRLLCIEDAKELSGLIPSEVLKEFSSLQSLNLKGSKVEVEPDGVSNLKKLETLGVEFKTFDALNSYLESRQWQRLQSYFISHKNKEFENLRSSYDRTLFWCKDRDRDCSSTNGESSDFVIPFNVEYLLLMNWNCPLDGALSKGGFAHLKKLTLRKCKVNYLISVAFAQQLLQNLEDLEMADCTFVEEIIRTEESLNQNNSKNYPTIKLPNLWRLCLKNLPRLRSIYKGNMELPSLEFLKLDKCEKLERLPFRELPVDIIFLGSNIDSILWRNSLQWDDRNHKQVFREFLSESKEKYLT